MTPLRILQVSDAYYPFPGGVSEHMHHLTQALRARGHEVTILTASYGPDDEKWREGVVRIAPALVMPPTLRLFNLTQLTLTFAPDLPLRVRAFMRSHTFDIVHTHGPLAPNLPHLALHYSRSVNVATFHTAFVGTFNFHKFGRFLFSKDARKIHAFVPVSPVAEAAVRPYYPGRYVVIPNGIDLKRFRPEGPKVGKFLRGPKRKKILYVGRLEPRKGLPYLLQALPLVRARVPDVLLIVVGEGPMKSSYQRMVPLEVRDRVYFEGFVPPEKLPDYYRTADLFTSPAVGGETFGIVLLEAMASGVPVVASDIPGYRCVIRHGENGLLTRVQDPHAYAQALIRGIMDSPLREKLREEGLRTAREHAWERIAERVESLYNSLLQGR